MRAWQRLACWVVVLGVLAGQMLPLPTASSHAPALAERVRRERDHLAQLTPPADAARGEVLVRFKPGARAADLSALVAGAELVESFDGVHRYRVPAGEEDAAIAALRARPDVLYAERNALFRFAAVPNDPFYATHQWNLRKIALEQAWDLTTGGDTLIAIVDTGIDNEHPDLAGKVVPGWNFDPDSLYYNTPDPVDVDGHGTHVAGIAAASTNNGLGVAGVAWRARILPVRVGNISSGTRADSLAKGIRWAADAGARIINVSLGRTEESQTVTDAVRYAYEKNALVIAAAGNEYEHGNSKYYPAASPQVLAVGATSNTDVRARYSNVGSYIDVVAPGGDPETDSSPLGVIFSTWPTYLASSGYAYSAGTSMAAAHVAGLAALLLSLAPTLSADELANLIMTTADDLGRKGRDDEYGHGRVNAARAVQAALSSGKVYSVAWQDGGTPRRLVPGATVQVPMTITNTGSIIWPAGGPNPVHLSYHWLDLAGAPVIFDGLRARLPADLPPGGVAAVLATVVAPTTPGQYILRWDLVQEGTTWFTNAGATPLDVAVSVTIDQAGAYDAIPPTGGAGFVLPWVELSDAWTTTVALYNPSRSNTATFRDPAGHDHRIPPLGSAMLGAADLGFPGGTSGSITYTGSRELLALALLNGPGHDAEGYTASHRGGGASSAGPARVEAAPASERSLRLLELPRPVRSSAPVRAQGTAGRVIFLPLLLKNVGSGWQSVVHLGSTDPERSSVVQLDFYQSNGPGVWHATVAVPPGTSLALPESILQGVPDGTVMSAVLTVTEGAPIGAVVDQHRPDGLALAYEGFVGGAPTIYAPLQFRHYFGYDTGIQVQNVGTLPTLATLAVYPQDGTGPYTYTATIPPGGSKTWDFRNDDQVPGLPAGLLASATVTSDNGQPLVGVVNELRSGSIIALSYNATPGGATTLYVPWVARGEIIGPNAWSTGLQVQNLGSQTANVRVEYYDRAGEKVHEVQATIAPGRSVSYDHRHPDNLPLNAPFGGSARVVSSNGVPIAAIVNFLNY